MVGAHIHLPLVRIEPGIPEQRDSGDQLPVTRLEGIGDIPPTCAPWEYPARIILCPGQSCQNEISAVSSWFSSAVTLFVYAVPYSCAAYPTAIAG